MNPPLLFGVITVALVCWALYDGRRQEQLMARCAHDWHVTLSDGILRCRHCPALRAG